MDDADRAFTLEQVERDSAINAIQQRGRTTPEYNEAGQRVCITCDAEIRPERIKAKPDVVRCIGCQEAQEALGRRYT